MSNFVTVLRQSWLRFAILLWVSAEMLPNARAANLNVTVLDTDQSISYQPASSWFASTNLCATCLAPPTSGSYHEAFRVPTGSDPDDLGSLPSGAPTETPAAALSPSIQEPPSPANTPVPNDGALNAASPAPTVSPQPPAAAPPATTGKPDDDDDDDGHGGDDDNDGDGGKNSSSSGSSGSSGSGKGRRAAPFGRSRFSVLRRDDGDDNVSLAFGFNGSAIYLFGYRPLGPSTASVPTNQNLSFVVDNQPPVIVQTQGSPTGSGFANMLLFSSVGLEPGPHQLVVNVGMNSVFLFDHLVYTSLVSANPSAPLAQTTPSQTSAPSRKRNIATFAGAVGGSVGVLGLFSLCLAFSIIRRRHLAAKRDRRERDHESLHTNASDDSPNMSGPAPFVPRFFPDTVIPSEPPTYVDAVRTNEVGSTLLAQLGRSAYPASRSYADIPPDSPPPPLDPDPPLIAPPPPFPTPLSSSHSPPRHRISRIPPPPLTPESPSFPHVPGVSESGSQDVSLNRDSVGIDSPVAAVFPELVPLLQPPPEVVEVPSRPSSRVSTRSISTASTPASSSAQLPEPPTISNLPSAG